MRLDALITFLVEWRHKSLKKVWQSLNKYWQSMNIIEKHWKSLNKQRQSLKKYWKTLKTIEKTLKTIEKTLKCIEKHWTSMKKHWASMNKHWTCLKTTLKMHCGCTSSHSGFEFLRDDSKNAPKEYTIPLLSWRNMKSLIIQSNSNQANQLANQFKNQSGGKPKLLTVSQKGSKL